MMQIRKKTRMRKQSSNMNQ